MKLGLTYDLRSTPLGTGPTSEEEAEFDQPETIEAIENALVSMGFETERIGNIHELVGKLACGLGWDLVFNLAEGSIGFGREAQIPALLDAYGIPYTFSDPLVLITTLHKAATKRIVRDLGFPTPDFTVAESMADINTATLAFPLFVKPVAGGSSIGISADSMVIGRRDLEDRCTALLGRFSQPVLIEEYLPGREFTVGIVGTGRDADILGIMEVTFRPEAEGRVYSYENKEYCETRIEYLLADDREAEEAGRTALAIWRGVGCRDAGRIDMRSDASGTPCFLEINPLAGLHPQHSDLPIMCSLKGVSYPELIGMIVESALKRLKIPMPTGIVGTGVQAK